MPSVERHMMSGGRRLRERQGGHPVKWVYPRDWQRNWAEELICRWNLKTQAKVFAKTKVVAGRDPLHISQYPEVWAMRYLRNCTAGDVFEAKPACDTPHFESILPREDLRLELLDQDRLG